jgi:hypothetical protein
MEKVLAIKALTIQKRVHIKIPSFTKNGMLQCKPIMSGRHPIIVEVINTIRLAIFLTYVLSLVH